MAYGAVPPVVVAKKPIGRSILVGAVVFTLVGSLCLFVPEHTTLLSQLTKYSSGAKIEAFAAAKALGQLVGAGIEKPPQTIEGVGAKLVSQEMYLTGLQDGDMEDDKVTIGTQATLTVAEIFPSQTSILYVKSLSQMIGFGCVGPAEGKIWEAIGTSYTPVDVEAVLAPCDGTTCERDATTRWRLLDGHHRWAALHLGLGGEAKIQGYVLKNGAGTNIQAPEVNKILNTITASLSPEEKSIAPGSGRQGNPGPGSLAEFTVANVKTLLQKSVAHGLPPGAKVGEESPLCNKGKTDKKDNIEHAQAGEFMPGGKYGAGCFDKFFTPAVKLKGILHTIGKTTTPSCTGTQAEAEAMPATYPYGGTSTGIAAGSCVDAAITYISGNAAGVLQQSPPLLELPKFAQERENMPVIEPRDLALSAGTAGKNLADGKVDWHAPFFDNPVGGAAPSAGVV